MARLYNRHHLYPRGHPKRNRREYIRWVKKTQHAAFHTLFPNDSWSDVQQIAHILNNYFINPDYELIVRKKT